MTFLDAGAAQRTGVRHQSSRGLAATAEEVSDTSSTTSTLRVQSRTLAQPSAARFYPYLTVYTEMAMPKTAREKASRQR